MGDGVHQMLGWLARAVGLFYLLGGMLTLRAGQVEAFLDSALTLIDLRRPEGPERLRGWSMMAIGALTAISGLALLLLSRWAATAFLANAALQAAYLGWASRALPATDLASALGRRRTRNAFAVWLVMTGLVLALFELRVLT